MGDEFITSLTKVLDPPGKKGERTLMSKKRCNRVFTGSKEETHPKTLSEGRSGLGASVADLVTNRAAVSFSNYQ